MKSIKFPKPEFDGEIRMVKNGVLMFDHDDWIIVRFDK